MMTKKRRFYNPNEDRCMVIPGWLLCRQDVGVGAKMAYGRLWQYQYEEGVAAPSVQTLAAEIGASPRSTTNYLRELRESGLISVVSGAAEGHTNRYCFPDMSGAER
jgi:hypothetical protein